MSNKLEATFHGSERDEPAKSAAQIIRERGDDWNIACSYGAHSWVRAEHRLGKAKRCTRCEAEYLVSDSEWALLTEPEPE